MTDVPFNIRTRVQVANTENFPLPEEMADLKSRIRYRLEQYREFKDRKNLQELKRREKDYLKYAEELKKREELRKKRLETDLAEETEGLEVESAKDASDEGSPEAIEEEQDEVIES